MGGKRLSGAEPGVAAGVLPGGVTFLAPEDAVFEAMLTGWSDQQVSRMLAATTVVNRVRLVRRFSAFCNEYPWSWSPGDVEAWTTHLVETRAAHSTVRNYQAAVQMFCSYLTDQRYGWVEVCMQRFGTHPTQVFHEWNTAAHRGQSECRPGNRPLSRTELQTLFDYCDQRVAEVTALGRKGRLTAFRDSAMFKTIYAFGLRRQEVARLDLADLSGNPHASQFGRYGALNVRYGKAMKGGAPRRRTVLTTMGWAADVLAEWVEEVRPLYQVPGTMLWPTERGAGISLEHLNFRFAAYRDACGLPPELGPHCLRHSYITHLIEDGFDHLFVQQQVGHSWGSTTAGYTSVGSDYKNQALQRALSRVLGDQPDHRMQEGEDVRGA